MTNNQLVNSNPPVTLMNDERHAPTIIRFVEGNISGLVPDSDYSVHSVRYDKSEVTVALTKPEETLARHPAKSI